MTASTRPAWLGPLAWSALLLAVLAALMQRHETLMFQGLDGQDMRLWAAQAHQWRSPVLEYRSTPLQGAGARDFEQKYRSTVIYGLPLALTGHAPALAVYLLAAVLLVGSLVALGLALEAPLWGALAGAWAAVYLSFPSNDQTGFYSLISLVPNNAEVHAFVFFAAALALAALRKESIWLGLAAAACGLHVCLISPMGAALRFVVAGATLVLAVAAVLRRGCGWRGLACLALWAAAAILVVPFVAGFYLNTPSFLMRQELSSVAGKVGMASVSILFDRRFALGRKVLLLGVAAALAYCVRGRSPLLRLWAAGSLLFHGLVLMVGSATAAGWIHYTGPFLIYLELPLSMFYCVIGGAFVDESIRDLGVSASFCRGAFLLLLGAYCVLHWRGPTAGEREVHSLFSRSVANPLVARLSAEIALHPGSGFRGYEASFFGFESSTAPINWGILHTLQAQIYRSGGNDMRMTGLWKFAIPTLIYENQSEDPWLFYATKRLLARPQDEQVRNIPVHSLPNVPFLESLGVRFVLAAPGAALSGARRLASYEALPGAALALFELKRPNLGSFSPTAIARASSPAEAAKLLSDSVIDFEKTAVVFSDEDWLGGGPALAKAGPARLTWEAEGLRVRASSPGRSLLVLPLIYSSAVEVRPGDAAQAVRINLCQTGLLFHGTVDVTVTQRYGPFRNPWALLKDYARTRRLLGRT